MRGEKELQVGFSGVHFPRSTFTSRGSLWSGFQVVAIVGLTFDLGLIPPPGPTTNLKRST